MAAKGATVKEHSPQVNRTLEDGPADIVFKGGDIFTIDDTNPHVEALAVKGERIIAVGKYADIESKIKPGYTQIVDLQGRTLLPGFIEAHQHATLLAASRFLYVNVGGYSLDCKLRTADEILKIIEDKVAATNPHESPLPWCMFLGWDIELVPELPTLTADVIDSMFSGEIPIMVIAQSGHAAWVNHKTFDVCGITSADQCPEGGSYATDSEGKLTGLLLEEPAIKSVMDHCPKNLGMAIEGAEAIHAQWRDYAARGFTTVTELDYTPEIVLDLYLSAASRFFNWPVRLALYVNGEKSDKPNHVYKSSKLWVAGVKFWADGSPHAGTSAIQEPYLDNELTKKLSFPTDHKCGILNWKDEELLGKVKAAHDQNKQVSIHAHGERAIDQCLNVYKQLFKPGDDRRHRLEHLGLVTQDQLKTCGEIGVATSLFVGQFYFYGKTFSESIFGRERTNRWAPLASAIKHVGKISIHQDHPTFPGPPLPFANIKTAVTRTQRGDPNTVYDDENNPNCISIEEAIKAYTIGPAYQLFKEHEIGSLEVGKYADLVILSTNPYDVDPKNLDTDVKVVETYIAGRCNNIHKE